MFIVVANRMSNILVHLIGHSSMEEFHTTNGKTVSCDTVSTMYVWAVSNGKAQVTEEQQGQCKAWRIPSPKNLTR